MNAGERKFFRGEEVIVSFPKTESLHLDLFDPSRRESMSKAPGVGRLEATSSIRVGGFSPPTEKEAASAPAGQRFMGVAERSSLIHGGDQIVATCGKRIEHLDFPAAIDAIKRSIRDCTRTYTMTFLKGPSFPVPSSQQAARSRAAARTAVTTTPARATARTPRRPAGCRRSAPARRAARGTGRVSSPRPRRAYASRWYRAAPASP